MAESSNLRGPETRVEGYGAAHEWFELFNGQAGQERGDTAKAAARIVELVATDPRRELPLRFAIGDDAYENLRDFHVKRLKELEEWKEMSTGTDVSL